MKRYDFISDFDDQRLRQVAINQKMGLIDENFDEIFPVTFDDIELIEKKYYRVIKDGLFGLYNAKGKKIIPCQYKRLDVWQHGRRIIIIVKNQQRLYGIYGAWGNVILKEEYDELFLKDSYIEASKDGLFGALDFKSNVIIPFEYDDITHAFEEDYIFSVKKNDRWGVVDENNNIIIPIKFPYIATVNDFIYTYEINVDGDEVHIFYDKNGNVRHKCSKEIEKIAHNDAITIVYKEGSLEEPSKYGVMELNGKIILKPIYKDVDFVLYTKKYNKMFFRVETFENEGFAIFDNNEKNITGFGCKRAGIGDNNIIVRKDSKVGVYDYDGNLITPFEYEEIQDFDQNEYAIVTKDGIDYGLINKKGEIVLDCIYDDIYETFENYATVSYNGISGIAYYK